jgi:selenocysteine lyase/cysteine desulfurase
MTHRSDEKPHRNMLVGNETEIPLLNSGVTRPINSDNAASTSPLKVFQNSINEFINYYSSVHRGTGLKSPLSAHVYEEARQSILQFVGADQHTYTCVFLQNTTETINKPDRQRLFIDEQDVLIPSGMEHHSNDPPWREAWDGNPNLLNTFRYSG